MSLSKFFLVIGLGSISCLFASEHNPGGQIAQGKLSPVEQACLNEQAFLVFINGELAKKGIQGVKIMGTPLNQRTSHKRRAAISPRGNRAVERQTGLEDYYLKSRLEILGGTPAPGEPRIDDASQRYLEEQIEAVQERINNPTY